MKAFREKEIQGPYLPKEAPAPRGDWPKSDSGTRPPAPGLLIT